MLNISENTINPYIDSDKLKAFKLMERNSVKRLPLYLTLGILALLFVGMFLPWTQNIQAKGYLTTLKPDQKPQAIQSVIAGRLDKWFIREGSFVEAGDTIVYISEIKSEYFDPNLVQRTAEQANAKSKSITSYSDKVQSLNNQYAALKEAMRLKLEQTQNKILQTQFKITSDSIDLIAYKINSSIAEKQYNRTKTLQEKGLKSLTDLEIKNLKLQETQAKVTVQSNKYLGKKNELINLRLQLLAVESEYADKLSKSQSDKYSALSSQLDATATTSKLENKLSNYTQRQTLYYITAPQSGYIAKTIKKGIGEIIKEGTDIVTIMPEKYDLGVEIYVKPRDLPLLSLGNTVRLQFDGWPAFVFSGWPNTSFGTFSGEVVAIDQFISSNGKYRLLIAPSDEAKPWPNLLRVGSGTKSFILLNDVPIWYELWRQLNGFPADFYNKNGEGTEKKLKQKAPLKSVK